MKLPRSDMPTADDAMGRFLPWLVAVMTFLASLAWGGALALEKTAKDWDATLSGVLTIQIPFAEERAGGAAETDRRVERALRLLSSFAGVAAARPVDQAAIKDLLEPWLGRTEIIEDLPVPRLIEVELKPEGFAAIDALKERLQDSVPGVSIDDHRVWLSGLIALAETLQLLALGILAVVGLCSAATVAYATRASLAVHRPHIEVLHLIGATDGYIAAQFARRAAVHGMIGGILGTALALPVLLGVKTLTEQVQGNLIPVFNLDPWQWASLAVFPPVVALLARIAARRTVRYQLTRML